MLDVSRVRQDRAVLLDSSLNKKSLLDGVLLHFKVFYSIPEPSLEGPDSAPNQAKCQQQSHFEILQPVKDKFSI